MKTLFASALLALSLVAGPASASYDLQVMRDTIGRSCSLMISRADPAWYVKNGRFGYRSICSCAVENSLKLGISEKHLSASLFTHVRGLNKEGRNLVFKEALWCADLLYGKSGPKFKVKEVEKPFQW